MEKEIIYIHHFLSGVRGGEKGHNFKFNQHIPMVISCFVNIVVNWVNLYNIITILPKALDNIETPQTKLVMNNNVTA